MKKAEYNVLLSDLGVYSKHMIDPETLQDKNNLPEDVCKETTSTSTSTQSQPGSQYMQEPKKDIYSYYKMDSGDLDDNEVLKAICAKQASFVKTIKNIMVFFCVLVILQLIWNFYIGLQFASLFS